MNWPTLLLVVMFLVGTSAVRAEAQAADGPTPAQRAAFNRLVNERNTLVQKMRQLDHRAAEALKQGDDPVTVHAEQVSAQDRLDLLQMRIDMEATRHGLAVPPMPEQGHDTAEQATRARAAQVFERGRSRAVQEVRKDCLAFLGSLDFESFLDQE